MKSFNRSSLALAASLSMLAGYVDAIGFIKLGGYFVSFMSGNTTRLVVALQEGEWRTAQLLALILSSFVIGAMSGALVGHYAHTRRRPAVLGYVTILLLFSASMTEMDMAFLYIVPMALAMGAVNALFQKDGDIIIGVTYMTGTLVKIGHKFAAAITGGGRWDWVPYILLWLGLVIGGLTGAIVYSYIGIHGLWFAALTALGLTIISFKHQAD